MVTTMQTAALANPKHLRQRRHPHLVGLPPAVRRVNLKFKDMAERTSKKPSLVVCDPQGAKERRLRGYLLTVEPRLVEMAASYDDLGMAVGTVDKSRQSVINKLGGWEGAGDKTMEAFWDIVRRATGLVGMINESTVGLNLIRISSISDEGISIIAGRDIPRDIAGRFTRAMKFVRRNTDLSRYKYTLTLPYGENEAFDLDLLSFSKVLRHPEMVVSAKCSMSGPKRITTAEREGFIMDEVRRLENKENAFFELLPESFRVGNGGLAEVQMPFNTSLAKKGIERLESGVFVEIKLTAKDDDARALLRFTKDGDGWTGTKKGYMEIFSSHFGMRGFNTYVGKARTNSVLTPICHAMKDHESTGATVLPVNGSHLQYWVDTQSAYTAELIRKAIERRISCGEGQGPGYANLGFKPSVTLLDAKGVELSDVRARFILKSLGKEFYTPVVLDMTDFLLNFIENIDPAVQERVLSRLTTERNAHFSPADRKNLDVLRLACSMRRTIRDTEDFVWILRRDDGLPQDIQSRRGDLEKWLFEFSAEKAGQVFRVLAEEIYMKARRK